MTTVTEPAVQASLLDAAVAYARRGWRVLPLAWVEEGACCCQRLWHRPKCTGVPGKHPLLRTGEDFGIATTMEFMVRRWWRDYPLANVGIVPGIGSGLLILDVDPKHGGFESLARIEAEHGPFPPTPLVRTPSGGRHYYFKHPGGTQIKSTVGILPGLDIRADGSLVVAPPSVGLAGRYEWI
jgi:putative DNA primase/helicase